MLKVLVHSCYSRHKTGFSRNSRAILTKLFQTGKYELFEYATGLSWSHPETQSVPWKCYGVLPDNPQELERISKGDQAIARAVGYGAMNIDRVVYEVKPDVILSIEDFWGINYMVDKPYFQDINCVLWTTLDSLPLLPEAVERANKVKNYFVWSEFAEREMSRLGHSHVKTLHGAIDTNSFYRLDNETRLVNRERFKIQDKFVIGFVFRNQLRKLVPNLFEGYSDWKRQNPNVRNTALLLHTHFGEAHGWDIPRLAKQYGVPEEEILTTYICRQCASYEVKPFTGQEKNCDSCLTAKAQVTTSTGFGITESQLNEIYNMMDVYIHPFTSGGQEMPIQEAKLTELVTLVTDYACGEDMCESEAGSLALEWAKYTEIGTQFIKASTYPASIAKQLNKVYQMKPEDRRRLGKKGRQWVIDNYSTEVVCEKLQTIIDSFPPAKYDYNRPSYIPKNHLFEMPEIEDNLAWVKTLYSGILNMEEGDDSEGVNNWLNSLARGATRRQVYEYFINEAVTQNSKNIKIEFTKLLGDEPPEKRILFCMPESLGDLYLCTSLFKSLRETYPDKVIYVATKPQFQEVLGCNPYIDRVIDWQPFMDNQLVMEGAGDHDGYFHIAFFPHYPTQRMINYLHNGDDKVQFDLCRT